MNSVFENNLYKFTGFKLSALFENNEEYDAIELYSRFIIFTLVGIKQEGEQKEYKCLFNLMSDVAIERFGLLWWCQILQKGVNRFNIFYNN